MAATVAAAAISFPRYYIPLRSSESLRLSYPVASKTGRRIPAGIAVARALRPVVERFKIHHEQNITQERLKELGVSRWSKWECGPNVTSRWYWEAEELVYITKGCLEITPDGCEDSAFFYAGDFVRFPKWFEAAMTFEEDYEHCYKFVAYGD